MPFAVASSYTAAVGLAKHGNGMAPLGIYAPLLALVHDPPTPWISIIFVGAPSFLAVTMEIT
jgi:hypothetical protein